MMIASLRRKGMLPASSFDDSPTLEEAKIMGMEPKIPLVNPRRADKRNAETSPRMSGSCLGAAHITIRGMIKNREEADETSSGFVQG